MMLMCLMKYGKRAVLLQIVCFVSVLFIITCWWIRFESTEESFYRSYNKLHLFSADSLKSKDIYKTTCFRDSIELKLEKLIYNMYLWGNETDSNCRLLYKKFKSMYTVELREAMQKFGPELAPKIKVWLGNSSKLYDEAQVQVMLVIHDNHNHRSTVYNAVRGKRPVSGSQKPTKVFVHELINATKLLCDFCHPLSMTAEDNFGRIQGKYSISAANVFKLDKWHGLFLTNKHSIFDVNEMEFLDLFNTSLKWFKRVNTIDANARYPVLFWDMLPHAGASQVHVHVHGIVGSNQYPGQFGDAISMIRDYRRVEKSHYWDDLIEIHQALGLALRFGKAVALAPLAPRRPHELWLISNEPCVELFQLLYYAVRMYQDGLSQYCYSMGGVLPTLGQRHVNPELSLPALIQIGTRGDCSSSVNDVSSLELYLFNNVNVDPYATISKLRHYVDILRSESEIDEEEMVDPWCDP